MKRLLLAGSLATLSVLLSLGDIREAQSPQPIFRQESTLPPDVLYQRRLESLIVNPDPKVRTIIMKDEEEGIRDLRRLARQELLEEVWAYLPAKKLWVEVGLKGSEMEVQVDIPYLNLLMIHHEKITLYHTHPPRGIPSCRPLPARCREREADEIEAATPSRLDLRLLISLSERFYAWHPAGGMIHKIASVQGITAYAFTEGGKERILSSQWEHVAGPLSRSIAILEDAFFRRVKSDTLLDPLREIQRNMDTLSTPSVHITFTP